MNKIIAFTDGASKGNPGLGGWGAVIVDGDDVTETGGAEKKTTNNRMEMMAALSAMEYCQKKKKDLIIYTDSSYLVNGITKWVLGWQKKGWKTMSGGEVLNRDLWEKLSAITKVREVNFKVVAGHVGIPGNERADRIASDLAEGKEVELYKGVLHDYKINVMDFKTDPVAVASKEIRKIKKTSGKAFSYLSMVKGDIKTHKTWAECEERVKGVAGAKFRKSFSPEDEKEIIESWREGKK